MPEQETSSGAVALLQAEQLTLADLRNARRQVYQEVDEKRAVDKLAEELAETLEATRSPEKKQDLSLRLGVTLWMLKRYTEAASALGDAGRSSLVLFLRGLSLSRVGNYAEALKELEKVRGGAIEEFDVDMAKASVLRATGDHDAAIKLVKPYEKSQDGSTAFHVEKAACLEGMGQHEEGIAELERALEIDPQYAPALFRLAYIYDMRDEDDQAVGLYKRCLEVRPLHTNALINLGLLHEDRAEFERAIACYRRVLESEPTHERARLYLKDALASKTMYYDEEAEKRLDRTSKVLRSPISDFELSVRSRNCLKKMNIHSLGDLVQYTEEQLLQFKNFGETSLAEIKRMLVSKGLRLGMNVEAAARGMALPEPTGIPPTEDERVLLEPIEQLELSVRSRKCLVSLGIKTVGELIDKTPEELLTCKNFGNTSLQEIREKLRQLGLSLNEILKEPAPAE